MAERDPEFMKDVLRIVYAALSDREALAAAMAGQQTEPASDATAQPPGRPSPSEVGVQGGAGPSVPPCCAICCSRTMRVAYEDLYLGVDDDSVDREGKPNGVEQIMQQTSATREEVMQELMRRALRAEVQALVDLTA